MLYTPILLLLPILYLFGLLHPIQGAPTVIHTTTTSSQEDPEVALLTNDNIAIVYMSNQGTNSAIYMKIIDEDGAQVVAESDVNTAPTDIQTTPHVAALTGGGFVVIWASDLSGAREINAQIYTNAGATSGGLLAINTETTGYQYAPRVAGLDTGGFVAVWVSRDQDGSDDGIYARIFNSAGTETVAEFKVNDYVTGDQVDPDVAKLSDGTFVVVWTEENGNDGSGFGVYAKRYNSAGVVQNSDFVVASYTTNNQEQAKVEPISNNRFIITWSSIGTDGSARGVMGKIYNNDASVDTSDFLVNTFTSSNQFQSDVSALNDGSFVVCWSSTGQVNSLDIFCQRFDEDADPIGGEFMANTETDDFQRDASVIGLPNNKLLVIWEDHSVTNAADILIDIFPKTATLSADCDGPNNAVVLTYTSSVDESVLDTFYWYLVSPTNSDLSDYLESDGAASFSVPDSLLDTDTTYTFKGYSMMGTEAATVDYTTTDPIVPWNIQDDTCICPTPSSSKAVNYNTKQCRDRNFLDEPSLEMSCTDPLVQNSITLTLTLGDDEVGFPSDITWTVSSSSSVSAIQDYLDGQDGYEVTIGASRIPANAVIEFTATTGYGSSTDFTYTSYEEPIMYNVADDTCQCPEEHAYNSTSLKCVQNSFDEPTLQAINNIDRRIILIFDLSEDELLYTDTASWSVTSEEEDVTDMNDYLSEITDLSTFVPREYVGNGSTYTFTAISAFGNQATATITAGVDVIDYYEGGEDTYINETLPEFNLATSTLAFSTIASVLFSVATALLMIKQSFQAVCIVGKVLNSKTDSKFKKYGATLLAQHPLAGVIAYSSQISPKASRALLYSMRLVILYTYSIMFSVQLEEGNARRLEEIIVPAETEDFQLNATFFLLLFAIIVGIHFIFSRLLRGDPEENNSKDLKEANRRTPKRCDSSQIIGIIMIIIISAVAIYLSYTNLEDSGYYERKNGDTLFLIALGYDLFIIPLLVFLLQLFTLNVLCRGRKNSRVKDFLIDEPLNEITGGQRALVVVFPFGRSSNPVQSQPISTIRLDEQPQKETDSHNLLSPAASKTGTNEETNQKANENDTLQVPNPASMKKMRRTTITTGILPNKTGQTIDLDDDIQLE